MVTVSPVRAQVNLPYATDILTDSGKTALDVGDLTLDYIYGYGIITFKIDEAATDLRLAETQLYVGDEPPGKIKPDNFPYQHNALGDAATDIYNIDLDSADVNGDGFVYVSAHVKLTVRAGATLKNGKSNAAGDTAWAQGNEFAGKGKNLIPFFSAPTSHPG